MLFGREAELQIVASTISAARAGQSRVLVIHGHQGVGKSALLSWAREHAEGLRTVRVQGVETEGQIAYAGLFDVLRPFQRLIEGLPIPQAVALGSALGLGEPSPVDRLAVYSGSLSLLAAAADDLPILLSIDDVGWLDVDSQEALGFVLRRLEHEPIVCLLAAGDRESGPLGPARLPSFELTGLSVEAGMRLLRTEASVPVPDHVAGMLVSACAGNPLALQNLPLLLTPRQLAGQDPLPQPLPVPDPIRVAFGQRLGGLPGSTLQALLLLAAADPEDIDAVRTAAAERGLGNEWIDEAVTAGLVVTWASSLQFSHPLLRAVVLGEADPGHVREAHATLAMHVSHPERRAWHRSGAADGPDEAVAAELESIALNAMARGAPQVAADGLERAARLSPGSHERASRLLRGAAMAYAANQMERTILLTDEVMTEPLAGELIAGARQLRAHVLIFDGRSREVAREAAADALAVSDVDPRQAAMLYGFSALVEIMHGGVRAGFESASRSRELAPRDGSRADFVAGAAYAWLLTIMGRTEEASAEVRAWPQAPGPADDPFGTFDMLAGVECLTFLGQSQAARELADIFADRARRSGDTTALQYALGSRAYASYRLGDWLSSYADAAEALRLALLAPKGVRAVVQYRIGHVEAGMGLSASAEGHLSGSLEVARSNHVVSVEIPALAGHGLLELARDRPREALDHLARAAAAARGAGIAPGNFRYSGDLMEAASRAGHDDAVADHVAYIEAFAAGSAWVRGTTERGHSYLTGDAEAIEHLKSSVSAYADAASPFDEARARLELGVRLRHLRRPTDARTSIARAISLFERLGAAPWLDRARRELAKAGGERHRGRAGPERLSPAELDVAIVVARGATNREAAAELFLSPKTIDHHLGRVYSKLGLRSRSELARHMASVIRD